VRMREGRKIHMIFFLMILKIYTSDRNKSTCKRLKTKGAFLHAMQTNCKSTCKGLKIKGAFLHAMQTNCKISKTAISICNKQTKLAQVLPKNVNNMLNEQRKAYQSHIIQHRAL
jgi:hypothetical protein